VCIYVYRFEYGWGYITPLDEVYKRYIRMCMIEKIGQHRLVDCLNNPKNPVLPSIYTSNIAKNKVY
jgi:hypothetical protein